MQNVNREAILIVGTKIMSKMLVLKLNRKGGNLTGGAFLLSFGAVDLDFLSFENFLRVFNPNIHRLKD